MGISVKEVGAIAGIAAITLSAVLAISDDSGATNRTVAKAGVTNGPNTVNQPPPAYVRSGGADVGLTTTTAPAS